jgi:protein-S-isoprenylcysteine O-methyltransferase Ste14
MNEPVLHHALLIAFFGLAAVTFPFLFFVTAPYGRYTRRNWGPSMDRTAGWILMEAPAALVFPLCFLLGDRRTNPAAVAFIVLWLFHYLHRAFVFPFRMRGEKKKITLLTVVLGVIFNVTNGYLNGRTLNTLGPLYPPSWIADPRFVAGTVLFFVGLAINLYSDTLLIRLRRPGESAYRIPRGGLFRFVSCPNYLGEILEWLAWALATWSLPGLAFATWTVANLGPRAYTHHLWYRREFPDYPAERRALIPFLV